MTSHAPRCLVLPCLAVMLCVVPAIGAAQSLADVARAAAAARKAQPQGTKVYTNESLKADITTPSAAAAPRPAPGAEATPPSTPGAGTTPDGATPGAPVTDARDTRAKEEAMWRQRMAAAREALDRSVSFAAALQSQINALTTDFINRDDPAQRARIEQQRVKAVAELERTQREIENNKKAIGDIEEEARKAGVPAGWLR